MQKRRGFITLVYILGKECIALSPSFKMLCLEEQVLLNVMAALHELAGDSLEKKNE